MVETGYSGRNSDGGIFRASKMGYWLQRDELKLPDPQSLSFDGSGLKFLYYFVADEAFSLLRYLTRPYPRRRLNNRTRIFNYR